MISWMRGLALCALCFVRFGRKNLFAEARCEPLVFDTGRLAMFRYYIPIQHPIDFQST